MTKALPYALASLGAVLAFAAPLSAARSSAQAHACTVSGATWKWRAKSGHQYNVYPSGTTCNYARSWAARLSSKSPVLKGGERVILGGPKGWSCLMRFPFPFPKAWSGSCAEGTRAFAWLPLVPLSAVGP
jgi:hypothetical protein